MVTPTLFRPRLAFAAACLALGLAACATGPVIRAQTAPGADLARYQTFGYFEKLGTDRSSYASVLSLNLKAAATREMQARGFRLAETNPDMLLNFHVKTREKLDATVSPGFGASFGRGWGSWRSGYSWGVGISDTSVRSTTEGTLTIDVVARARNEILWSGTAAGQITSKVLDDPKTAIDSTVPKIFAKFPKAPAAP